MIKELFERVRERISSLYVRLLCVIIFGIIVGVGVYSLSRLIGNSYINTTYLSEENKDLREREHIERLQKYITENALSSEDMREISEWAKSNRYVYLLLYKDDELFFTSDMIIPDGDEDDGSLDEEGGNGEDENTDTGTPGGSDGAGEGGSDGEGEGSQGGSQGGSGITVEYPTREELYAYAAANDQFVIELTDGMLLASVADFSEYFHYDLSNIISLALAMVVLGFVILNYFRHIIVKIKRLEADVTVVTHTNMNHKIHSRGYDEISRLSGNVENMRISMLENLEGERAARAANTELITAMSHDIRTPLTVLFGYLDMMKGEASDSSVLAEYISASEKTAMRLKLLCDDMFKYSLVFGDGGESPELEDYDAVMLFEQLLSEHVLLLKESGYEIELETPKITCGLEVRSNAQSLMRIIDNIFSNLRKYADVREPVRIKISVEGDTLALRIYNKRREDIDKVESNGIGMKTCVRLASLVGGVFRHGFEGEIFVCELLVKVKRTEPVCFGEHTDAEEDGSETEAKEVAEGENAEYPPSTATVDEKSEVNTEPVVSVDGELSGDENQPPRS